MKPAHVFQLLILAALWGSSFLFMRIGVAEFGVAPLIAVRLCIGAIFLTGLVTLRSAPRETFAAIRTHAIPLIILGVMNSGAPFCLFAFAELTLAAGPTSVLNATTPLWGALIAYIWFKERLTLLRIVGMVIGFGGVITIVWDQMTLTHAGLAPAPWPAALAAAAASGAALCYGIAANFTKRYLSSIDSLTLATGSMIGASIVLLPFAIATWPATPIPLPAWGAALSLGVACTGVAYFIYFHLLTATGPARAMAVTFILPVFGILWGALFLREHVSLSMLIGCAIVLVGTALSTGVIKKIPGLRQAQPRHQA